MTKRQMIVKLVREIFGYLCLTGIMVTTLCMLNTDFMLQQGALIGALLTGGMAGIVGIALNQKEPKSITTLKEK